MARRIFTDSSAFIAMLDPADGCRAAAAECLARLRKGGDRFVTTNFILDEVVTRFRRHPNMREMAGRAILESAYVEYVRLEAEDEDRAWQLCLKLRDQTFSFTDLTSFALMERLGLRRAFTFDRDFRRYGRFEIIPRR